MKIFIYIAFCFIIDKKPINNVIIIKHIEIISNIPKQLKY